jgi:hypothetical protein
MFPWNDKIFRGSKLRGFAVASPKTSSGYIYEYIFDERDFTPSTDEDGKNYG